MTFTAIKSTRITKIKYNPPIDILSDNKFSKWHLLHCLSSQSGRSITKLFLILSLKKKNTHPKPKGTTEHFNAHVVITIGIFSRFLLLKFNNQLLSIKLNEEIFIHSIHS